MMTKVYPIAQEEITSAKLFHRKIDFISQTASTILMNPIQQIELYNNLPTKK